MAAQHLPRDLVPAKQWLEEMAQKKEPGKDARGQQSHAEKRIYRNLKSTFEDSLPC